MTDWDLRQVGFLEMDFVLHCGASTDGEYAHSLSAQPLEGMRRSFFRGIALPRDPSRIIIFSRPAGSDTVRRKPDLFGDRHLKGGKSVPGVVQAFDLHPPFAFRKSHVPLIVKRLEFRPLDELNETPGLAPELELLVRRAHVGNHDRDRQADQDHNDQELDEGDPPPFLRCRPDVLPAKTNVRELSPACAAPS